VIHPGSSTATSPREISGHPSPAANSSLAPSYYPSYPPAPGQIFQQQGMMTESPKPLSPGQPPPDQHRLSVDVGSMGGRNRSPSLTTQFQQQHFGRGSGRGTPPQPQPTSQGPPVLPPLTAGQQQGRSGLQPSLTSAHIPSSLHHQQIPPSGLTGGGGSNQGSLSSHGRSSGSSMRDIMGGGGGGHDQQGDIWGYVRSLEARFSKMQEEYELRIRNLQDEVISLKGQVSASQSASYGGDMQRYHQV